MATPVSILVDNMIQFDTTSIDIGVVRVLKDTFTYANPEYYKKKAMGYYVTEKEKFIQAYKMVGGTMLLPRGTIYRFKEILDKHAIAYTFTGQRTTVPCDINYLTNDDSPLTQLQEKYATELSKYTQRILLAPPGMGKTRTILKLISLIKQKTLIVVHTNEILKHWINEITTHTDVKKIGQIGAGKKTIGDITIAMIQTLNNCDDEEWDDINKYFGCVVISEVQHCPAERMFETCNKFKSKYRYGETASRTRKDGKEFLMFDSISSKIVEVPESELHSIKRVLEVEVHMVDIPYFNKQIEDWVFLIGELVKDTDRNTYICNEVIKDANNNHKVLVMSDRKQHCYDLQKLLAERGAKSVVLTSDVKLDDRKPLIKDVAEGDTNIMIATSNLISEGANIPALSCLHLVTPSNNFELTKQKVGRIRRVVDGKNDPVVKDYVDNECNFLKIMAKKRHKYYQKLGFTVKEYDAV